MLKIASIFSSARLRRCNRPLAAAFSSQRLPGRLAVPQVDPSVRALCVGSEAVSGCTLVQGLEFLEEGDLPSSRALDSGIDRLERRTRRWRKQFRTIFLSSRDHTLGVVDFERDPQRWPPG
ncbi:hypothetical protein RCH23_003086 [Cryobacterium sp. CAN_C3]|uniref:hypothetical protein n=1 Tax=unclassified Cryobacterium TaxID=2649013 RepID=UPI0018CAFD61|nr:hypothetical protein [Cryobacterium sp. CAN_C3]MEC5155685.1 hypothetical protein [Cryobacterium sp. CAN_C3]